MTRILRPSIIDVEASGFGQDSYPIEIGVILTSGKRYCSLIFPAAEWTHWDVKAAGVHGITRPFLEKNGRPATEVARALNRLVGSHTVYTDAWSVDVRWITLLFYTAGIYQEFKVSALENILSENQMNIWHDTKSRVQAGMGLRRHRASSDAYVIQETYAQTQIVTSKISSSAL